MSYDQLGVSGSELVEGLNRLALRIKLATFLGGLGGLSGSVLVLDAKLAYDNHELSAELQSYLDAQNDLELLRPQLDQAKAEVSAGLARAPKTWSRGLPQPRWHIRMPWTRERKRVQRTTLSRGGTRTW